MLIYFSDADEDLVMEIFIKVPAIIFGFLCATCIGSISSAANLGHFRETERQTC